MCQIVKVKKQTFKLISDLHFIMAPFTLGTFQPLFLLLYCSSEVVSLQPVNNYKICFLSHLLSFVFYCDNQDTDLKCFQLRLVFVFLQQQHLQPPQMMLHNILRTVPAGVECGANTLFMNCQLSQKCGVMFCTVCNEQYASSQKLKTTLCLFVKSRSWYDMCRTFVRILTLIWLLELK